MPEDTAGKKYVSEDMPIGEVVANYPEAVPVLLKYGLHCIGCQIAMMETLRDGLLAHGMTEEDIKRVVSEINETIENIRKSLEDGKEEK